ncbi:MAG: transcription elongation factor GreA [Gammaproteobacteria bacterium]|nr:transcription elongation factor GreA [Gammaproteobacteria bacterium]
MNQLPLTAIGCERLKAELKDLKMVRRPSVIDAIATARDHGDLKENAEYHAAREEQGFIEGRIKALESAISNSQIIDILKIPNNGRVIFGCTVDLIDAETEAEVTYQIVGDIEADINENRIAISSPIARALIGKEVEEEIVFEAPGGTKEYVIEAVHYI